MYRKFGLIVTVVTIFFGDCLLVPITAQNRPMTVCGAETGQVYLRSHPQSSSQNPNRTLANGTPILAYRSSNGFVLVETLNGTTGWITERYLCSDISNFTDTGFICDAETGRVYFRVQPDQKSQDANRTLSNGTRVKIHALHNNFVLVETFKGHTGWITERYICR